MLLYRLLVIRPGLGEGSLPQHYTERFESNQSQEVVTNETIKRLDEEGATIALLYVKRVGTAGWDKIVHYSSEMPTHSGLH